MVTYILFKLECRASHYDVIVVEQATMTSLFSLQGRIRFDSFFLPQKPTQMCIESRGHQLFRETWV